MQLRELSIEGFGIFSGVKVAGLMPGINVYYGENEQGKTTLLEFIRRVLFGFPARSTKVNPYESVHGSAFGGILTCEMATGELININRKKGTHGGVVTVHTATGEIKGQDGLNDFLGHLTKEFYNNIYAFSLEELQEIGALQGQEVKNRIYGAGLGLGNVSITEVQEAFLQRTENVFKEHGSANQMAQTYARMKELEREIRQIQTEVRDYSTTVQALEEMDEEVATLNERIGDVEIQYRSLDSQIKLFPVWLELDQAQQEFESIIDFPNYHEDTLSKLEEMQSTLNNFERQITQRMDEMQELEIEKDLVYVDTEILQQETAILSLQKSLDAYNSSQKDIIDVRGKRDRKHEDINKSIAALGKEWDDTRILGFSLTYDDQNIIEKYRNKLDRNQGEINHILSKSELHQDNKLSESTRIFNFPKFLIYVLGALTFLGLGGVASSIVNNAVVLTVLSAVVLILSSSTLIYIKKSSDGAKEDQIEIALKKQLVDAENQRLVLTEEWNSWLTSIHFTAETSPETVLKLAERIGVIQSEFVYLDEFDQRIASMDAAIKDVERRYGSVVASIQNIEVNEDVHAHIEILLNKLTKARQNEEALAGKEKQIAKLKGKLEGIEVSKAAASEILDQFVTELGAKDPEEVQSNCVLFQRKGSLLKTVGGCRHTIQSAVGSDEAYTTFIQSVSSTNIEKIRHEMDELSNLLYELKESRDASKENIGELKTRIKALSSSEELIAKQSEFEIYKQRLNDHAREWVTSQIALLTLRNAIRQYETTRQPEVIKAAITIFDAITGGRYSHIVIPADESGLFIRETDGTNKTHSILSRGTREQLYMSMRLGLIEEYEKRSEPMPIVMDDILVNFDDNRGPATIRALQSFASDRQVLIMTCHNSTLQQYKDLGANEVVISPV